MTDKQDFRDTLYAGARSTLANNGLEVTSERVLRLFKHIVVAVQDPVQREVLEEEIALLTEKVKNMGEQHNEDSAQHKAYLDKVNKPIGARLCSVCRRQIGLYHCQNRGCTWCVRCADKVKR